VFPPSGVVLTRAACRPERSNVWVAPLTRPWWVASSVKVRV